jgi:hypothetical protein
MFVFHVYGPRQHLDDAQQLENMLSYEEQVRVLFTNHASRWSSVSSIAAADCHGAGLEPEAVASDGTPPRCCAVRKNRPSLFRALLEEVNCTSPSLAYHHFHCVPY